MKNLPFMIMSYFFMAISIIYNVMGLLEIKNEEKSRFFQIQGAFFLIIQLFCMLFARI